MYNALISDIDGTIIPVAGSEAAVTDAMRAAVTDAMAAGKHVACATGREWALTRRVVAELGITDPCVVEGGTRIVDPISGKTLWEKDLDDGVSHEALAIFRRHTSEGLVMHSVDTSTVVLGDVRELPHALRFLYILSVEEGVAAAICNDINARGDAVAHMTPSWYGDRRFDIHVTHPEATKEHAIVEWQRMLGVTRDETIGMGDSGNDIPLFASVGVRVAVGNASPALKELSDYIAPAQQDGAFEHVVRTLLLKD